MFNFGEEGFLRKKPEAASGPEGKMELQEETAELKYHLDSPEGMGAIIDYWVKQSGESYPHEGREAVAWSEEGYGTIFPAFCKEHRDETIDITDEGALDDIIERLKDFAQEQAELPDAA